MSDAGVDPHNKIVRSDALNPQTEYTDARKRFDDHIAALKSAGKSSEAALLESRLRGMEAAPTLSEQLDAAMQAGGQANSHGNLDEALRQYEEAVELAQKIQPHDQRLPASLELLGNEYLGRDPAAAESAYERELKATQEVFGAHSPHVAAPLQSLGRNELMQRNYAAAEKFFFEAVDVNEKALGENSNQVAFSLMVAASVYGVQKDYAKAEPYILRALHIDESLYGSDGVDLLMALANVCTLYDRWGKPDKLEPYNRQMLAVLEKQYGPNSPRLASTLTTEAKALRELGRDKEAADVEDHLASIRSETMGTH